MAKKTLCFLQILAQSNLVKTNNGTIEGYENQGLRIFKGIPFAAAPVGDRRFRKPEPPAAWEGVRSADTFGSACAQKPGMPASEDEDWSRAWSSYTQTHIYTQALPLLVSS